MDSWPAASKWTTPSRRSWTAGLLAAGSGAGSSPTGMTVFLLAPEGIARDALTVLLEREGFTVVVAQPGDDVSALPGGIGVALVHERLPDAQAVMGALLERSPPIRSILQLDELDERAFRKIAGSCAAGGVGRFQPVADLVRGLASAMAGGSVLPAGILARPTVEEPGAPPLTAREADVLALLVDGSGTREIADRLGISLNTVRTHLAHLMAKFKARSRLELVVGAIEHGLGDRSARRPRAAPTQGPAARPDVPHPSA